MTASSEVSTTIGANDMLYIYICTDTGGKALAVSTDQRDAETWWLHGNSGHSYCFVSPSGHAYAMNGKSCTRFDVISMTNGNVIGYVIRAREFKVCR